MELRTTEEKINELLSTYEEIRRSSILQPEQQELLPSVPTELVAAGTSSASITINSETSLVGALRRSEEVLKELRPRVEKFRKRLFEIDPVTEKPRYGPKSQARVRLLVTKNDFLCSQYTKEFPEQYKNQQLQLEQYRINQLELQKKRQDQRRLDHIKKLELQKKQEQENGEEHTSSEATAQPLTIDANMNPDGSIIITQSNDRIESSNKYATASPASLLFAQIQQQYELKQQEQRRQEELKESARLKEEEENRRRLAENEANQRALEAQQAAERAAEEEAQTRRLHQQAEEARLRRRTQEEERKEAERKWLDSIKKGASGVKYYLDILLQRSSSPQQQGEKDTIDPDRIIALRSLFTLFDQIQKHPEEINNRKIKLDNPNFHRDIGRHEGGIELLVAAGFRPTMLPATITTAENENNREAENHNSDDQENQPEIAFLISKEPSLEHDMDGWMIWFDLNKATLEILQTELNKVDSSKRSRK